MMGSNDISEDEKPIHEFELPYDYWLAKYLVTVEQYRRFVEASGYKTRYEKCLHGYNNHPVTNVVWYDALAYCRWLNEMLIGWAKKFMESEKKSTDNDRWLLASGLVVNHLRVTLPSEAEWEKGARGTDGRTYPWGDEPNTNRANYNETGIGGSSTVGVFPTGASPYGLLDISGNVWEWTRTIWSNDFQYPYQMDDGREDMQNRVVPRVLRGGSYVYNPKDSSCPYRFNHFVDSGDVSVGFRVAVSPVSIF